MKQGSNLCSRNIYELKIRRKTIVLGTKFILKLNCDKHFNDYSWRTSGLMSLNFIMSQFLDQLKVCLQFDRSNALYMSSKFETDKKLYSDMAAGFWDNLFVVFCVQSQHHNLYHQFIDTCQDFSSRHHQWCKENQLCNK